MTREAVGLGSYLRYSKAVTKRKNKQQKAVSVSVNLTLPKIPWKSLGLAILIVTMAVAGWYIYQQSDASKPVPQSVVRAVNFPLYYPTKLPDGFHVDRQSIKATNNQTVEFSIEQDNQKILVTEAAKPELSYEQIYSERLADRRDFDTPAGKVSVGNFKVNDDRAGGSLLTARTWVIVIAPRGYSLDRLSDVMRSFSELKP